MSSIGGIDPSVLLSLYQTQLSTSPSAIAAANAQQTAAKSNSATANDDPPWNSPTSSGPVENAKVLSTTNYVNTTNVPLSAGATTDSKMEQDNQKLFSLYNAVSTLSQLAQMAQSSTATSGQLTGLNTRFQTGLSQVEQYLQTTSFNTFNLEAATPASTVTSTAEVPISNLTYSTQQLVTNADLNNAVSGVSASDSFTIGVTKNGVTTNVPIDLSQVQGTLSLPNIVNYVNSQLSADGFSTRIQTTEAGGTATSNSNATYGLQITPGGDEQVSLSADSTPALYIVGNSGLSTDTNTVINSATSDTTTTPADQTGALTKISNLDSSPTATYNVTQDASTGITSAQATVVDSSGNVYVIGNATGNIGNQINQGTQDVYLTKYDSAGNVVWQSLLGSSGSASGYGLALDPATGGVVVTGSTTADLTTTAVANGNTDSFVASYNSDGSQQWVQQVQTLATNQSNAVSVDASGNIYIGGSVSGGVIGTGQTESGASDAYLAKFSSSGTLLSENQFGSSGNNSVAATATGSDGSLYVASVQNGQAIVSKYANGNITSAPEWTEDLGALQAGGNIGGIAVSGNQVYVSGSTSNTNLAAGGTATIAAAASGGGLNAFVFGMTDNGSSATAGNVSYVGTSGTTTGGAVTVGSDGTVYLTGSTTGTFAGQSRSVTGVTNSFATAIAPDGGVDWTRQFGGADGVSTGSGVALDPTGSSVLDALGLPQGTVNPNQSVDLTQQTTLRAGDSFQIQIEGTAPRTTTITINPGETYDTLVTQINAELGAVGKAAVNYTGSNQDMTITINPGNTINLIAGPTDFNALSRLGIAAGVLSAPAKGSTSTSSATASTTTTSSSSSSSTKPTYGIGLTTNSALGPLNISSKTGADLARSTLLSVMSNIQQTYQTTNAPPPSSTSATTGNTTGTASAATTAQLASYNMALSLLGTTSSNAMTNIEEIVAGLSNTSTGSSSNSDLSSLLNSSSTSSLLGLLGGSGG